MTGTYGDLNGNMVSLSASSGSIVNNADGTWSWSQATDDGPGESGPITITANDGNGGISDASFSLVVSNVAPTASWSPPAPVNEGDPITLALTNPFDPSNADMASLTYAFDCGSGYSLFGSSSTASCPTADNGTRVVGGKIRDKDGGESEQTSTVSIKNVAPSAVFSATNVDEGSPIALALTSPTDPSSADTMAGFTFAFDCGAGFVVAGGTTAACMTTDDGTRTVVGSITDKDFGVSTYSSTVTIANVAPTATFNAQSPVNEGSPFTLALNAPSDPSSADTAAGFTYAFDCGTGSGFSAFGGSSTESCPTTDNGSRTVRGQIRDKNGAMTEYTAMVTVANVNPTATFTAPSSVNEGSNIALALVDPVDPSSADVLSYAFDYGNGNGYAGASTVSSASCPTDDDGSRTVRGKIIDDDGGFTEYSSIVTITNVAPTATFSAQSPVDEGTAFNLALNSVIDPSSADMTAGFTYAFDCGSGYSAFGASSSASCLTTDNGSRAVSGKVKDNDGVVTEYTSTVTVNNVAPTITGIAVSSTTVLTATVVTFTGSLTDPGVDDTHTWQWTIDGVANAATSNVLNTSFSGCGIHLVTATATDDDGGVSAPFSTNAVTVFEAHFRQPIDEGAYNVVQKGRVIPIKIEIGCDETSLPGLAPSIQLLRGDVSTTAESGLDPIETLSSSAADTTGIMRDAGGHYMYNLKVPSNATVGQYFTVRVRPFGDSNPSASFYAVLKVRK